MEAKSPIEALLFTPPQISQAMDLVLNTSNHASILIRILKKLMFNVESLQRNKNKIAFNCSKQSKIKH
ncbi:MAG TPA: hypothetical protein DEF82_01055 [Crocinitomicaceae bacterium]|nr:hypothetical protein [Flavobacteriales bacterium]HBW85368.1 hypothetical protein [Crocinitomicaceae bacterium]